MKPHLVAVACLFALTACMTVQEVATDEAMIVCTQGGYGPGTQYHAYCMENPTPPGQAVRAGRGAGRRSARQAAGASRRGSGADPNDAGTQHASGAPANGVHAQRDRRRGGVQLTERALGETADRVAGWNQHGVLRILLPE